MQDLISRQAAIDAIENEQKKIMHSDWAIDQAKFSAMSEIRALIEELPSVSTEKTGQWIKRENEFGLFECSVCKDGYIDQPTCMGKPMFKYCPNCGADIRGEE